MKLETHIHTRYSHDSILCFGLLYIKLRLKGIDCVAITEHNNIDGGIEFKKYCDKRNSKISVIVGEEIMTDEGEVIGLFLSENIPSGLSADETIARIKNQKGLVYIPHPFDEKRNKTVLKTSVIERNVWQIDCIECYNGRNIKEYFGIEQKKIADRFKLPIVVGSDAHTIFEVGRNYMIFNSIPHDSKSFCEQLNNAEFVTHKCISIAHVITKLDRILKFILKGKWNELFRAVKRKFKISK